MRITAICYKHLPHRLFEKLFRNRRSLKPRLHGVPKTLREKGVPVYDGYKFSRERDPVDFSKYFPTEEKILQPEFAYSVPNCVRLTEGDAQIQLLTNSLYHKELPAAYRELFERTPLTDSEYAWMNRRFELIKHDSFQVQLPVSYSEEFPWIRKPRPFGAPVERICRQISLIFNDFVRMTSSTGPPKPTLNDLSCQYIRPSENPYVFHGTACAGTLSTQPLPLVGDPAVTGSLPSMYPAAPEMDLEKTHDYDPRTIFPILPAGKDYCLHTIYVNHPHWSLNRQPWTIQEKTGIALLQTFSFAAARAATAKKPLVMQTVYHDEQRVDFVVMQLNTLQSSSENENNIRNEIWHHSTLLNEGNKDQKTLNPTVLKWLKVFYAR